MDLITKVKLLLNITSSDKNELLTMLVEDAINEVVDYCNLKSYEEKLDSIVVKMVVQNYNKISMQGITSHSYSGVSETFVDGYSADVMGQLNKNRRVRFL